MSQLNTTFLDVLHQKGQKIVRIITEEIIQVSDTLCQPVNYSDGEIDSIDINEDKVDSRQPLKIYW